MVWSRDVTIVCDTELLSFGVCRTDRFHIFAFKTFFVFIKLFTSSLFFLLLNVINIIELNYKHQQVLITIAYYIINNEIINKESAIQF